MERHVFLYDAYVGCKYSKCHKLRRKIPDATISHMNIIYIQVQKVANSRLHARQERNTQATKGNRRKAKWNQC